ncbi:MAG: sensor hybrid histidine kinase [Rariglobus sp.]|jgi:PAS domain S-box-containing protein|nr:sensor hybrid histidine kinase [Rariglobus sp.]
MHTRFLCGVSVQHSARFLRAVLVLGAGVYPAVVAAATESSHAVTNGAWAWTGVAGLLVVAGLIAAWCRERRERRRSEARLSSASDRLRALFDESPLSICVFDPNDREIPFRIVECNQYACDLHGWTREELIGRGMEVLTPLKLTYEGAQKFLERLRTGPCRGENPHWRKDGSVFYIEYVARLVVIDGREYMIGVDRDLSTERARRDSEEALRHTAELNQLVLRASNDGIWDWRIKENRITFSERCREMLGYTVEELSDDVAQWHALIHPEDALARVELLRRHWEEDAPYVFQFRCRHKDGTWRWIVSRGITLFDEEHRPVRMVGSRIDITAMKRMDAELLQSRKLRAVGEMVGGIAHEFNNLLTPMLLHAELLAHGHEHDLPLKSHLGPIRVGLDRARELTQRILTFGRRSVDACTFLDLEMVVRDNLDFLARTIDRRIQITLHPALNPEVVWANRSDLNQLVVNLVLNARDTLLEKAGGTPPAGWVPRIEISLESFTRASGARDEPDPHTPRRWHRLTVRDNGLGISEEVRERVFEPFFTTKTVGQGTGLGLATAWHVSTALGGWIEIESREGEGSAFHVFMPASEKAADLPVPAAPPEMTAVVPPPPAPAREQPPRLRVLLVEDSEIVAFATQRMIESFGHEVHCATDGQAAWTELASRPGYHDMVFTDLNLPGVSGVELVRRLREARFGGRVVVYSGYFSSEHEAALTLLSVDALLQKPFTRAQLGVLLEGAKKDEGGGRLAAT